MKLLYKIVFLLLFVNLNPLYSQWVKLGEDIGGQQHDHFGESVAISFDGNRIAVGAIQNSGSNIRKAMGYVQVFQWDGKMWTQLGKNIEGIDIDEQTGYKISLSKDGNILAISAPYNDENGKNSGQVRVYSWKENKWTLIGASINGNTSDDWFGSAMSLSSDGTKVIIGSPTITENGSDSGQVRVFSWNGKNWEQIGQSLNGDSERSNFGKSVSISSDGKRIAISNFKASKNGNFLGKVSLYEWKKNKWKKLGDDIIGKSGKAYFGESISMSSSGEYIAIGAKEYSKVKTKSGQVRVYKWNKKGWIKLGKSINGESKWDRSGGSVSISHNGLRLAIGAQNNGGVEPFAGHVRIFEWQETSWVQLGIDIDGEAKMDRSSYSLQLSPDGNRIIIGAPFNKDNGPESGHIRVYEFKEK